MKNRGHAHGDRGLAGAGVTGERHMQTRDASVEAVFAARGVHQEERRYVADALFDRREADQLLVEFGQQREHILLTESRVNWRGCGCVVAAR